MLTMDDRNKTHVPGWVWIVEDRIRGVGPGQPTEDIIREADREIDAANMIVLPGLVNAHTHLSQSLMRGLVETDSLSGWLPKIRVVQAAMTSDDVLLAALLGLVENLHSGVTTVVQHHKVCSTPQHVDAAAIAAQMVGPRMILARGWRDLGQARETPHTIVAEMSRLHNDWHNAANGRITLGFGPTAPSLCSDEAMHRMVKLARKWGLPTHIHIAETAPEVDELIARTGLRHVQWLSSLDALGADVHLVHCVWVNDYEVELIAKSKSIVVHCPTSNMYLGSGVAPLPAMLSLGIPILLGTDGPASNNSQDTFETMKNAGLLAKVTTTRADVITSQSILRMATSNVALLLGRRDIGHLQVGAKADITIVNLNAARTVPALCPVRSLVYSASESNVHTVVVDGRILLDSGRATTVDEAELLCRCRHAAERLYRRIGIL